ncbi:large conductance mechanosensitive channel protein MscL [Stackebrandtia soli]|uniref:large conductance mechanosensitive channel protein MscL n=1 Tax=Stackebrandtia soli TaxID=1892856 RepID=UPI0039E8006C
MIKGFRDFLMRGNVVDLAVAVVMGAAMTALVVSFTGAFIEPAIKLVTGGGDVGGQVTINGVVFPYSEFINGVISFVMTGAVVYFAIVLPVKKLSERFRREAEEPTPVEAEEIALLREIRDELRSNRVSS